jgi:hypothetical protein
VITPKVVADLRLPVIRVSASSTAAGITKTTIHNVHLWLPGRVVFNNCYVSCTSGLSILGVDLLIGMDIIGAGDFSVSNFDGKTVMTFRMPSIETIDYVKANAPRRNALCFCGSGKKYKHCHGKGK